MGRDYSHLKVRRRLCWWCNGQLAKEAHAEVTDPDGNKIIVHVMCREPTIQSFKRITAQLSIR